MKSGGKTTNLVASLSAAFPNLTKPNIEGAIFAHACDVTETWITTVDHYWCFSSCSFIIVKESLNVYQYDITRKHEKGKQDH